jgi:hypothetical protein
MPVTQRKLAQSVAFRSLAKCFSRARTPGHNSKEPVFWRGNGSSVTE